MKKLAATIIAPTTALLIFGPAAIAAEPMTAKATPGQAGVPAYSELFVSLQPSEDLLVGFGDEVGTITIYSNQNTWSDSMNVFDVNGEPAWHRHQIAATFPATSECTQNADETFRIEIDTSDGRQFVADEVAVIGPEDQGWPPTHDPGSTLTRAA